MVLLLLLLLLLSATVLASPEFIIISDLQIIGAEDALSSVFAHARRAPLRLAKRHTVRQQEFGLVTDFLTPEELNVLRSTPGVFAVVENIPISHSSSEDTVQWNLDRIDQLFGEDGLYTRTTESGLNVDMYIIDSGIRGNHIAFGDRVRPGYNADTLDSDCNGHGTHVASTAAGDVYGVARGSTIFPVRILRCDGKGTLMELIAGVSWTLDSMETRRGKKSVVNLSIQSYGNAVVDDLVRSMHLAGAVVVVAAANFDGDACNYSPAREPLAVTVGATSEDDSKLDASNSGSCVDLFAPGDNIRGASFESTTGSIVKRGTSMASPIVAGVIATIWERFPLYSNTLIIQELLRMATPLLPVTDDVDCRGQVTGALFLQSLASRQRPVELNRTLQLAKGSVLQGDFLHWMPDLSLLPVEGEICISFSAKMVASRTTAPIPMTSVRVAVATNIFPVGISTFFDTLDSCKDPKARWWILSRADDGSRPANMEISDFQNQTFASTADQSGALLSGRDTKKFYVSIKQGEMGLVLELGAGEASLGIVRTPLVTGVDVQYSTALGSITRVAFSANRNYDVEYTNIRPCVPPSPTSSPSLGYPPPPSQYHVTRANRNVFNIWPEGWVKPLDSPRACFSFRYHIRRAGKVYVALAEQILGRVRYNNARIGFNVYVLVITQKTVRLLRNGLGIHSQPLLPKIAIPQGKSVSLALRVTADELGTVQLERQLASGEWTVLYMFVDDRPGFLGTQFSLTSSTLMTFTQISVC